MRLERSQLNPKPYLNGDRSNMHKGELLHEGSILHESKENI